MAEDYGYSGTEDQDGQAEKGENTSTAGDKNMLTIGLGCQWLFLSGLLFTIWPGSVLVM